MSAIDFKIDTAEFQKAMQEYQDVTGKDGVEVVNRTAGDVALRAAGFTPKSSKGKIFKDLWKLWKGRPAIYRQVNAEWATARGGGFSGERMAVAAQVFQRMRVNSIAFLRSGWKECARDFGKPYREGANERARTGARLGKGTVAKAGINPTAWLYYFVPAKQAAGRNGGAVLRFAQRALASAISYKIQDMRQYMERKMAQRARKFSAK